MWGPGTIAYERLMQIEEELVPESERGKLKMGTFLNMTCLPENDCEGVREDWENVLIYRNAGETGTRYKVIQWYRPECCNPTVFLMPD